MKVFNKVAEVVQTYQIVKENEQKKREAEELKQKVLELAFASDSEEDSVASDSGSEWEESAPLYSGDDDEE